MSVPLFSKLASSQINLPQYFKYYQDNTNLNAKSCFNLSLAKWSALTRLNLGTVFSLK